MSVSDDIPNLAGQKAKYLVAQLKAFKAGTRKSLIMNPIAGQLSDGDIANLAAHWNSLPGGDGKTKSEMPAHVVKTRIGFPNDYKKTYTHYTTISFDKKKQVRKYYANPIALKAAKAGKPMPNGAVYFVEIYLAVAT